MIFEESVTAALEAWSPTAGGRVHPNVLPQNPIYPAITYQRIRGRPRLRHLQGQSGLAFPLLQVDCWARTYAEAKALATEVRLGFGRHRPQTPLVEGGPIIGGFELDDDQDLPQPGTLVFRVMMQARVMGLQEALP